METDEEEGEEKKDDSGSSSSSEDDEEDAEKEAEKTSDVHPSSAPVPITADSLMPPSLPPGGCIVITVSRGLY